MPNERYLAWRMIEGMSTRPELYGTTRECVKRDACRHELQEPFFEQIGVEGLSSGCLDDGECFDNLRDSLRRAAPDWAISGIEGFDHGCRQEGEYGCYEILWNSASAEDEGLCSDDFVRVTLGQDAGYDKISPGYCDSAKYKYVIHAREEKGHTYGVYSNSEKRYRLSLKPMWNPEEETAEYDTRFCQVETRFTDSSTYELSFDSRDDMQRWDFAVNTQGMVLEPGDCPERYSHVCREYFWSTGVMARVSTKSERACDRWIEEEQSWSEH